MAAMVPSCRSAPRARVTAGRLALGLRAAVLAQAGIAVAGAVASRLGEQLLELLESLSPDLGRLAEDEERAERHAKELEEERERVSKLQRKQKSAMQSLLAEQAARSEDKREAQTKLSSLMADLRGMGEANAMVGRKKTPTSRRLFLRAAEIYRDRFGRADGRIPASFEIITLTGWAPHEDQQKPLRPGSAAHRLADTLGVSEHDPEASQTNSGQTNSGQTTSGQTASDQTTSTGPATPE